MREAEGELKLVFHTHGFKKALEKQCETRPSSGSTDINWPLCLVEEYWPNTLDLQARFCALGHMITHASSGPWGGPHSTGFVHCTELSLGRQWLNDDTNVSNS